MKSNTEFALQKITSKHYDLVRSFKTTCSFINQ